MKNEIVENEQINDKILVEYLDVMGITPKLEEKEKSQFLNIAKICKLNPFKREIYCTVYGEGQYKQFSILTGYEVYIKRAERSGQLDGWSATTSGSVASGDLKAIVTIYRKDRQHPFIWEVLYDECVQKTKQGVVTKFWEKANFMTKKVAISQGFRLCFSDELGSMPYTSDEMPNHSEEIIDIKYIEVTEPKEVKIVTLSKKQFEILMNSDLDTVERNLNAIEQGLLKATQEQHEGISIRYSELKSLNK